MNKKGFTLIEVLLVIVIIAILAGIVIIAVNPSRQIKQANNSQRDSDVKAIIDAVYEYSVDNRGAFPSAITNTATEISAAGIDICTDLVPTYLAEMPYDPTGSGASYTSCSSYATGYTIVLDATTSRITVAAPSAELSETISVTR